MSMINAYGDPIITNWEIDDNGEKISVPMLNETKQVVGNKIVLEGLPDEQSRVFIDGFVEINIKEKITESNQFKVDYRKNGVVFVHESLDGQWLTVSKYSSRGVYYIPSSRIWTKVNDFGEVIETLDGAINKIELVSDIIANLGESIDTAKGLRTELNTSINTGNTTMSGLDGSISTSTAKKTQLDNSISTSTKSKSDLDTSISSANTSKSKLDISIGNATTSKSNLDSSISSGDSLKVNLDESIATGTTLKSNLDTNITTGNQLKVDLPPLISSANTAKTNLDGSISTGNTLKGELGDIISGTDYEQVLIDVNSMKQDQHSHDNKESVLDNLTDVSDKLKYKGQDIGVGDMEKQIYDTNNNGKVDVAENAEKLGGQLPVYYAKTTDIPNISGKADKTYVDSEVTGAKGYADTKVAELVGTAPETLDTLHELADALGHDPNFATTVSNQIGKKAEKTYVDTELGNKVDNSRVLTDVPLNAKFTDVVTTINGKTGAIAKADIVALGIPASDTNTTYTEITTAEIDTGTASTLRAITGRRVKYILDKVQGWIGGLTKSDVGLSNVDNLSAASIRSGTTKTNVGLGNVDNIKQMPISGGVLENYREKLATLSGTSTTINLSLGNVFTHTLAGNTTYTVSNAVTGQAHSFTLIINIGSSVRTLTFPSSVKWQGGEIPDMSTKSKIYLLTFITIDGGTTWLGMFGGEF